MSKQKASGQASKMAKYESALLRLKEKLTEKLEIEYAKRLLAAQRESRSKTSATAGIPEETNAVHPPAADLRGAASNVTSKESGPGDSSSLRDLYDAVWKVTHSGIVLGPMTRAELVSKASTGKIDKDDLVKQDETPWVKARDLDFLRPVFPASEAIPSPSIWQFCVWSTLGMVGLSALVLVSSVVPGTPVPRSDYSVAVAPLTTAPFRTATTTPAKIELRQAVSQGLIRVSAAGRGLESVTVSVESDADTALEITIRPGTLFRAAGGRKQNMLTRALRSVVLSYRGARQEIAVPAACVNMHKDTPTGFDGLTLSHEPDLGDLARLLSCPDFARQTFRVQQFAVWTITDNPPDRTRFAGITGNNGPDFDGTPSVKELQTIWRLFQCAGIDVYGYRAF